jgi:hypothetical protein
MTFTGSSTSGGNEGEIQINKTGGFTTSDPNLVFDQEKNSLTVTGKIEQKVSDLRIVNQYALGNVKGLHSHGGNYIVTSGNNVFKLDHVGNILSSVALSGSADQVHNNGIEIFVMTTSSDTITILDQSLNVLYIFTDPINLPGPTRFIRHGKFLLITCTSKVSKFNTITRSIDGVFSISTDTFIDLSMKGSSLIVLRQSSVSEINISTMTLVKNVPSSNIVNPRRLVTTRTNVYVLCSHALLTFDTLLQYKGKRTSGLSDASTIVIYGSFLIVSNDTSGLSIYDASTVPVTLLNTIDVYTSPNTFKTGLIIGNKYLLTDFSSGNLFEFVIDGIVAGGIKAGSAEITTIETSEVYADTVTATNVNAANFYTSGSILGTSGTLGGITFGNGIISGPSVQIDSGLQSIQLDQDGFKYLNNSETVVHFKNNGTFEAASIETGTFKISNGTNKFQISASPNLVADQTLVFPYNNGSAGDMLANDGSGNLVWRAIDPAEVTIPGGFTSHIQYNTDGVFSGSESFRWDDDNTKLIIGETDEITISNDVDTSTSSINVGMTRIIHDTAGSRLDISDGSSIRLTAGYNTSSGTADITLGNIVISESGISGLSTPTAPTDAVNKNYVDMAATVAGNSFWKDPVTVATTGPISTFPPTDGLNTVDTIDGISLSLNDRVLIKDQLDLSQNGIYIVGVGTWGRAPDLDTGSTNVGTSIKVLYGDKYGNSTFNGISGSIIGSNNDVIFKHVATTGVSWNQSVRVATDTEITTFPPTDGLNTVDTIDGISLSINDRVLIKNQSNGIHNGIYVVSSGTWGRAVDFDTGNNVSGSAVWVNEGTNYADQGWVCVSDDAVVGTNVLTFDIMASETTPGGSNMDIQFNNSGVFGGTSDFTWDGSTLKLADDKSLTLGNDNDLVLSHSGTTNSLSGSSTKLHLVNTTGYTTLEAGTHIIMKQGSTSGSTYTDFQDSAGISIMRIHGDGHTMMGLGKGYFNVRDNSNIALGNANDCVLSHNGTNTFMTNSTGNLIVANNDNTSDIVLKLGDSVGATKINMTSGNDDSLLTVTSDGNVSISNTMTSEHIEQKSTNFYIASSVTGIPDARGIDARGEFVYIASTSTDTVRIFKSDPFTDSVPVLMSTYANSTNVGGATRLFESNGTLFVGGTTDGTSGFITSINVDDPEFPAFRYKKTTYDVDSVASMLQLGCGHIMLGELSGGITMTMDVADPSNIVQVRLFNTGLTSVHSMDTVGEKIYFVGDTKLVIAQILHTQTIQFSLLETYTIPGVTNARSVAVQGNYAYVSSYNPISGSNGISVIDVSKPTAPVKVGTTFTSGETIGVITDSLVSGKYLYVLSEETDELHRIDISDPVNLSSAGSLSGFDNPAGLSLAGNYIYVTNRSAGSVSKVNIGPAQLPQISCGNIQTTDLSVTKNVLVHGLASFDSSLSIGGSVYARGNIRSHGSIVVKGDMAFYGTDNSNNYITLKAPPTVTPYTLTLPSDAGTAEQVLKTDGSGTLSWVDNTLVTSKTSVTQVTSVNTGVTVDSKAGKITTVTLNIGSHSTESFTVSNTECFADSIVLCNIIDYSGSFNLHCGANNITNGSFDVVLTNSTGGPLDSAAVIGFMIV